MPNKKQIKKEDLIVVGKDTNIAEIVYIHPEVADVMLGYGLHCVGCFASVFDTISEGAKLHGMTEDEVDEMIEEINLVLSGEVSLDD